MRTHIPFISVIIPTYNNAAYIGSAIESVLAQSYKNFEIIIVDDGSTDNTAEILKSYQTQIRYFYQDNQGVASARNRGLEQARGELVAFLDADDRFWPEKLWKQVECFQRSSSLGMVMSGWQLVDSSGVTISDIKPWEYFPVLDLTTIVLQKPARPSALMLCRDWCEKLGGFNAHLSSAEDLDFLLRLLSAGCESEWIPEILVDYRQHSASLMSQATQLIENTNQVMERFFSQPDLSDTLLSLQKKERYQSNLWLAAHMYFNGQYDPMQCCLKAAQDYAPERTFKTALEWFQSFCRYAHEYGVPLDSCELMNSSVWHDCVQELLPYSPTAPTLATQRLQSSTQVIQDKSRILLYSDDPGAGGILQCNHAIVSSLAESGYDVSHLHFLHETPLSQREMQLGISQIKLEYHAGDNLTRSMKDLEGSRQHLLKHQPDLIVFSDGWPFSNLAAKQAAIDLNIPYIIVLGFIEPSCEYFDYQDGVSYRDLVAIQYSQAQKVITVSQENLERLRCIFDLSNALGETIYNGRPDIFFEPSHGSIRTKIRQELNIPINAIICFTSGRLEPIKGHCYQIEAMKQLRASDVWNKLYFVWAGTGIEHLPQSNELELKQTVHDLGIGDRVKFLGQRWDIPDLLDASDIFILSSEAEGMPLSVMEAMAKGLPVIASAVSGIPEELGETGQLIPDPSQNPAEAIAKIAETLEAWVASPQLRQSIGQACRHRADRLFRESTMVQQYEKAIAIGLEETRRKAEQTDITAARLTRLTDAQKQDIQRQYRYTTWVWQAWYQHQKQQDGAMGEALNQALQVRASNQGSPIIDWGCQFSRFYQEQGQSFDSLSLMRSPAWQEKIAQFFE